MKYSILIPSYDPELKRFDMVIDLIKSVETNSKGKDYELIIRKNGPSYTESHNDALRSSRGDTIVVLNDDVLIQDSEWLEKLTAPGVLSSWQLGTFGLTGEVSLDFACWSMPRDVFEKIGYFDEAFKNGINFEDNDYCYRATELGIPFRDANVSLTHYGSSTIYSQHEDFGWRMGRNQAIFYEKWKPNFKD